jgi:serine/threonine protein kinase
MGAELDEGGRFAGYRIDGLLARGGMGTVYRAHAGEGETIALKVITAQMAEDLAFRQRFEREVRLAAQVDHPHVVPLLDSGEHEGTLYMVSRLIDGRDLAQVLTADGRLSPAAAAHVTGHIGAALDAAHGLGLLHRDVKPQNVLIEGSPEQGNAYLTDFGLSKHVASTSGLTRAGSWVGTIDYASPEQLQGLDCDHRVDVYALGCVLYEMLTGEIPFPKARSVQKMIAHISEPPPAVSTLVAAAGAFDQVVAGAMAKLPDDRFETAGALAAAAAVASGGGQHGQPEEREQVEGLVDRDEDEV